jgi:hypothetical protein
MIKQRNTVTDDFQFSAPSEVLLKTIYNAEQSMNHHNVADSKVTSRILAVIKMEESISLHLDKNSATL